MTSYADRLKEERAHLSDDAVIERALSRIQQDEEEKARARAKLFAAMDLLREVHARWRAGRLGPVEPGDALMDSVLTFLNRELDEQTARSLEARIGRLEEQVFAPEADE